MQTSLVSAIVVSGMRFETVRGTAVFHRVVIAGELLPEDVALLLRMLPLRK